MPIQLEINLPLVASLVAEQFPLWSHLPIRVVEQSGWDNRTFRLGEEMLLRLPSAEIYAPQVEKEQKWLPYLAKHLSYPIPKPIALGKPSSDYPWNWAIYQWIEGKSANNISVNNLNMKLIASQLASFLNELHQVDTTGGPIAGNHNFYRGAHPLVYDSETKSAIIQLSDIINTELTTEVWEKAISSKWDENPVWVHGDFSAGNILLRKSEIAAVLILALWGLAILLAI